MPKRIIKRKVNGFLLKNTKTGRRSKRDRFNICKVVFKYEVVIRVDDTNYELASFLIKSLNVDSFSVAYVKIFLR